MCELYGILVKTSAGDYYTAVLSLQTEGSRRYAPTGCVVHLNNISVSRLLPYSTFIKRPSLSSLPSSMAPVGDKLQLH